MEPLRSTGDWRAWVEVREGPRGRWNIKANGDILCWQTERGILEESLHSISGIE